MTTTTTLRTLTLLALATGAVSGCAQYTDLTLLTDAPPTRVASVVVEQDGAGKQIQSIALSAHIAVGLECTFVQTDQGSVAPCEDMEITAAPADVVRVLPAYLSETQFRQSYQAQSYSSARDGVDAQGRDRSVVVLVGQTPGAATLTIAHTAETIEVPIEVLAVDAD